MDEVDSILWAYCITPRTIIGETPFSLVYGAEAIIPVEIGMEIHRIQSYEVKENNEFMREALDWIDKKIERAYLRMEAYKSIIRAGYFQKIKIRNF